ncbi:MAG: ATP-binding cassette domain-containing protein [Candidatus Scalindua rubra]|nr:ATP-binding cassette domain-containing protein [Candidatus Scalindua rubra]TWU35453.1 Glycine betaine/carnitine/choline transport ATP-binding protein OpuCA [Candidatus Brocadiaceae bacterium S225]
MIDIQGVSKVYGQTTALHSIDLTIPASQTTVLIGQSGCGKSTILRLIIGLVQADSGSVYFEGTRVTPEVVISLRRKMGYVIQEGGLFPHLTAYDNVALMARYLGWSDERIKERLDELAELTHFPSEGLERFPVQLSGGQQQRVSLMRALMLDPDVLLLDEPLGALDPMIRADLQVDLKRIFQALGKTVILVTHDIAEACFFGDIITLLRDGRVLQKGTLDEFIQSPADAFVTRFINAQRSPLDVMGKDSR